MAFSNVVTLSLGRQERHLAS